LLAILDACDDQLTVVSAPGGYGKTLLLADWAALGPDQVAWVSLDEDDNDDHRFWAAVLTALCSSGAVGPRSVLRDLDLPGRPSDDPEFLAAVEGALAGVRPPVRLVLDDVHELTDPDSLRGLAALAHFRSPGTQLVLSGRTDPPLAVARMRLAGELCEIRARHLRFSTADAAAMLSAADVSVRPDQVALLVEQTDGWAAGLRLAGLSLREVDDSDRFLSDLVGNSRAMSDYLVGEILSRIATDVREFLSAVSICDQLPARLATALSGRPDAGAVLDALERDTSLVLTSGEGRRWYRVHPLLRSHLHADLCRRRPDLVARLHARAAGWFDDQGQPVPAIVHARLGGDHDRVALLLRQHAVELISGGQHSVVQAHLAWLGAPTVDGDPWFLLVAALAALEVGAAEEADTRIARAAAGWPPDADAGLVALRDLVRSRRAGISGDATGEDLAFDIVEPPGNATPAMVGEQSSLTSMAALDRALELVMAGRLDDGRTLAEATLARARRRRHGYLAARALTVLGSIAGAEGDYRRMTALAERADVELPDPEWRPTAGAGLAAVLRAYGAVLRAEPSTALDVLGAAPPSGNGVDRPRSDALHALRVALRGAASFDLGHRDEGLYELDMARAVAAGRCNPAELTAVIASLEHGAATVLGRHDLARTVASWAEKVLGRTADVLLMRARRQLALGRPRAAADGLGPLWDGTASVVLPWTLAEGRALLCLCALRSDRRREARQELEYALALAASMDVVRPLAFGPAEVIDLLTRHVGSFGERETVARRVLEARRATAPTSAHLRLTQRERDVLSLLPTPRSLEEIAAELTVSHSTVKTHVKAIYTKLDVSSRREAVVTARDRGLLSAAGP
jgi:LuxR family transcriptional regulator, maltose regulon positive regulatory protein